MRVQSDRQCKEGWLHPIAGAENVILPPRKPRQTDEEVAAHIAPFFAESLVDRRLPELAKNLGVSVDSLEKLGVGGLAAKHGWSWTFPERNAAGLVIGLRRRFEDGKKLCVKDGRSGLFIPNVPHQDTLYLVEGPTDTAALVTMGLWAVGRPSNTGGIDALVGYIKHTGPRSVVVLGEHDWRDKGHDHEYCRECWPGWYGMTYTATRLADGLDMEISTRLPPYNSKDVRQWLNSQGVSPERSAVMLTFGRYFENLLFGDTI